ncbi:hypothetical protein HPO96_16395 [Kribbella sandramycini]|uniref:DUF4352 domain-containing protein n=1 Tax=Kribbella sandramycini TaxID=60450 RepID=A0A7Y4L036_9ACTN|nr:hypothetical protein [Kribbella sandramycini]MBB6565564.1 hypothetical protein [Kribbella sandramycini]NOL41829.1 hypothetical protein [Kribbella sandramycini]
MKLYRPATILVGILFVLIGGLTRLATPEHVFDEQNIMISKGTIGEPLQFGKEASITVVRVKLVKGVLEPTASSSEKPIETDGIFVAVEWQTSRGPEKPDTPIATLTSDSDAVFSPIAMIYSGIEFGAAGFTVSGSIVFEVDPTELQGLTLDVRPQQFWNVLNRKVSVDLGIPSEESAQKLIDNAAEEYVLPRSETRVSS